MVEQTMHISQPKRNGLARCPDCSGPFERYSALQSRCRPCWLSDRAAKQRDRRRGASPEERQKTVAANRAWARANSESLAARRRSGVGQGCGPKNYRTPVTCSSCAEVVPRTSPGQVNCARCGAVKAMLRKRVATGIKRSIKRGSAGLLWSKNLSFDLNDFLKHMEKQFQPGMTWSNMGDWHIDHIVPLSSFGFSTMNSDEFRACWALSNLRPLWAAENRKKFNKRELLL